MFPPSIGILIENPSFINNYTAFENLKTLASIRRRIDDNRIRETLTEIGLDPDDKRTFHKFSLGMKQRLGIAAAIMENPDIIILDEPINALDDTGTEQIRDILIRHRGDDYENVYKNYELFLDTMNIEFDCFFKCFLKLLYCINTVSLGSQSF